MGILRFNEGALVKELDRLWLPFRVVFAAASAERLVPAYASFSRWTGRGNETALAVVIERLWLDLEGNTMDAQQVQESVDASMSLIPEEDSDPWVPERAWAEDAAAAVAYALRCRQNGQSQEAAWAARRVYEALDHFVISQEGLDVEAAEAEEQVLSHPLVQAELLRQRRDLDELLVASQRNVVRVAQQMRERARAEADAVFKPEAH